MFSLSLVFPLFLSLSLSLVSLFSLFLPLSLPFSLSLSLFIYFLSLLSLPSLSRSQLTSDIKNLRGKHRTVIVDVLDNQTIMEGLNSQHLEKSSLGGSNLGINMNQMHVGLKKKERVIMCGYGEVMDSLFGLIVICLI